jgi:signal transduction histidine kinase/FixJ family two-component response regulator
MAEHLAVLIADDSEDDALLMTRELRRIGFDAVSRRVDTAETMAAALREQAWDLILADYRMPRFSGSGALEVLQASGLDIPFILVSATVGEETAVAMMKAGAHDFVLKHNLGRLGPVVARELREAEMRRQRRWAEAALAILAEAGKLVVEAADLQSLIDHAAEIAVPRLADWCIVHASDNSGISGTTAVAGRPGIDPTVLGELARRFPPVQDGADPWLGKAVASRAPVLISTIGDDRLTTLARDGRQLELMRLLELRSVMMVPLIAREHLVGILVLGAQRPGRYGEAELGIANEIGRRIAAVVENARLARNREEFISTAIHEIKTPTAVIKTAVQLMEDLPAAQRDLRMPDLLERLNRQCNRLDRLVTEVLEVSRLDLKRLKLNPRATDLAALVERVVGEMRDVGPRHELVIRRNDAVTLTIDPDRIEQVLTNLLANAIKYSPPGSQVEVQSRRERSSVVVSVRDRGIGIPPDKQARIFERFYRAHVGTRYEHASSLGVGLYLSREFVERHGGRMWFESSEGVGSVFCFSLPLQEAP